MEKEQKLIFEYKNKNGEIIKKYYDTPFNKYINPICYRFEKGIIELESSIPKGGKMMLYNYDNLVKGIEENKEIYFLGNEFDAEYLAKTLKLTTTTFAHYAIKTDELKDLFSIFKGTTLYITTEWLDGIREYDKLIRYYLGDKEYLDYWKNGKCYDIVLKILYEYTNKCYILPTGSLEYQDINYFMNEECKAYRLNMCLTSKIEEMLEKLKSKKYELDGNNFLLTKFQPNDENEERPFGNPWHRWWTPKNKWY